MPPRKRINLAAIMDAAHDPATKKDAPASISDAPSSELRSNDASVSDQQEVHEPPKSRGAAGRTKYQQNQARRKELKEEALADCNARGVGGAENVSMAWFQRLEANGLLTPSQKTLFTSLRANAQHSAPADGTREQPRMTPLQCGHGPQEHHVDTVHKKELCVPQSARAQLEACGTHSITAPQGTAALSSGASEREEIRKELAEVRKLLAADAARRKKKENAVAAKTAAAAAAPPPPKPAAEARVYKLPSFMSTSTW
jgi:hypothetical protein